MKINFLDLGSQIKEIRSELNIEIENLFKTTSFIKGESVELFEKEFARKLGVKYCISCANGTDALYISLKSLNIGRGDEVITVSNTWVSTVEVIIQCGAKPVIIDVDEYCTIDISKIENQITPNTKAIIPVHLYGQCADMNKLKEIAERHGLKLIEDCAQSHFSKYDGKNVGSFGDVGTFSFYPGKNLGAIGDAGCIVTNNKSIAEFCRMYSNHGALIKHEHLISGINSRLDTIHAIVLRLKLKKILSWNKRRTEIANMYSNKLKDLDFIELIPVRKNSFHTYHLYVIHVENRDALKSYLDQNGIQTGIHYPKSITEQKAFLQFTKKSECPVAESNSKRCLSLPMHPHLKTEEVDYIIQKISDWKRK